MNKSSDINPLPPKSKDEARQIFQTAFLYGSVRLTKHCREQMEKRCIDNNDLLNLARSGIIVNAPEPHIKTGDWNYRIESSDGHLKTQFAIIDAHIVRIITVMTA